MHSNQDVNRKMFFSEYCEIETKNLIKTLKYSISHLWRNWDVNEIQNLSKNLIL